MIDALKKIEKKYLIILGCIILLPIIIILFLAILQSCNSTVSYDKYEEKMISAFEKYLEKNDLIPMGESEYVTINLEKLVKEGYIKSPEKLVKDSTCEGSVGVRRNGASIEQNDGGFLNYTVNLECKDYSTVHLIDKIKEDLVTVDDGLYQDGEDYIFKGEKPNNYINFFGLSYRIVSIDKDGILKLIRSEVESSSSRWDSKFNVEINKYIGINIYKDSTLLQSLINIYVNNKKISKNAREHVMAYDVCIGKRSSDDYSISKDIDCSEILEDQVISVPNVSDFARASLDPNCDSTNARSCTNYNYLTPISSSTWTLNPSSENTYHIMYISSGIMIQEDASKMNQYNVVIYIDGNELYKRGIGSQLDPYVLE